MKTIEEFIKQIEGSADLQNEINTVTDIEALSEFLKKYDVNGTVEDFTNSLKTEGKISDDEAEAVAGGSWLEHIFRDPNTAANAAAKARSLRQSKK